MKMQKDHVHQWILFTIFKINNLEKGIIEEDTLWFAATWALRSDMLSCKFLVPELPGYFPGSIKAAVTAAKKDKQL